MRNIALIVVVVAFIGFVVWFSSQKPKYSKYGAAFRAILSEDEYYTERGKNYANHLKETGTPAGQIQTFVDAEIKRQRDSKDYQTAKDYDFYKVVCQVGKDNQIDSNLLAEFAFSIPKPDDV